VTWKRVAFKTKPGYVGLDSSTILDDAHFALIWFEAVIFATTVAVIFLSLIGHTKSAIHTAWGYQIFIDIIDVYHL